jgi:hypothetical protein
MPRRRGLDPLVAVLGHNQEGAALPSDSGVEEPEFSCIAW